MGPTAARRRFLMCRLQYHGFLAAGPGDRCGAGEGFEAAGVGETAAVVTDLGGSRAPVRFPSPGKLVMMAASGCCSKWAVAASARSSAARHAASNWCSNAASWMPIARYAASTRKVFFACSVSSPAQNLLRRLDRPAAGRRHRDLDLTQRGGRIGALVCHPGQPMGVAGRYAPCWRARVTAALVKGHEDLPVDGHEICPVVATDLPVRGHRTCLGYVKERCSPPCRRGLG